jgi:flavin reductase (DIM6/NTAB) family NADH-FMN oxidoreductase RutF
MPDKQSAAIKACLQPRPNILVSCRSASGENNALAVAYCCNCSFDPPMLMVGIVPSRYSYGMVKETGVFVVNVVAKSFKQQFDYLGSVSGRTENKLEKLGLRLADGVKVNAPLLLDCPINIECRVVGSIVTGSHEMFAGRIEQVHADAGLLSEKGEIDFSKLDLL